MLDVGAIIREKGSTTSDNGDRNKNVNGRQLELTTFILNNEEYGIEINRVKEIITVPKISKVITAPNFIKGIINLRGEVIPIVDMRKRFYIPHICGGIRRIKNCHC
ncbi:chemotaxis protein CheW [Anaerobacillus sp. HL2]|nr:chemotaxis protein CheW [Anaerobacillus sp. HL2]